MSSRLCANAWRLTDIIPEDFVEWGDNHHLPHIHSKIESEPYIHFPWENNSCGLHALMTAWWVLYNIIHKQHSIEVRSMLANNCREISGIFSEMYEGNINNLQAKAKIRENFQGILDVNYQNYSFVELRIINTYLEDDLYTKNVENSEAPALLHWNIRIT